jgi:hypothetical protein
MTTVANIIAGNGYYDRAEVLWALLMVCDGCGSRTIDCRCQRPDTWGADERLLLIGQDLQREDEAASPPAAPGLRPVELLSVIAEAAVILDQSGGDQYAMEARYLLRQALKLAGPPPGKLEGGPEPGKER